MIDINHLDKIKFCPHYFGLGFIQLKINDNLRYHFYHPELCATLDEEEIHDHRYDFTSRVLKGSLYTEVYSFHKDDTGDFIKSQVSCDPNNPIENSEIEYGRIKNLISFTVSCPDHYFINKDTYHKVSTIGTCITKLVREPTVKKFANVIRNKNKEIVCPFKSNISTTVCWEIINECITN